MKHECDKHGDNKDGWPNCSICGETDWGSLFNKNFKVEEVMNLITQGENIMDELCEIEVEHFENNITFTNPEYLIHSSIMDAQDISEELVRDGPFDEYLKDRLLLVCNLVQHLNKKQKMKLFIISHDKIFGTPWVETYDEWTMKDDKTQIRTMRINNWMYKNE